MARIDCPYCAYCFDEALLLRQALREEKEAEEQAAQDTIAAKRQAMGVK